MAQRPSLVIVESPAKARTIAGFLGKDFLVESSIGHIRDLPRSGKEVSSELKKKFGRPLGVDVENDFEPLYLVSPEKKQQIAKLKGLLAGAGAVYLATDEDREGESIAWHLLEVLKPKVPVKRMVFHEITKLAIEKALANPRELDRSLVDAQETRRIVDRLYGFEVSSVLWKKIMQGLSAGRVQSPATRIVVEREAARMRFKAASYWGIDATFHEGGILFGAAVTAVDGERLATGKDFDDSAKLRQAAGQAAGKTGIMHLLEPVARELAKGLEGSDVRIASIERKPTRRSPAAPFMTSTLQQESGRKLRYSAKQTMGAAQKLYEGGFITYMRTDSTVLSEAAVQSARAQIGRLYGKDYLPDAPRQYTKKVKNAQEAHEAIRPAGEVFRTPEEVAREVGPFEARLYELVWMRTVASQMKDSLGESVQVKMEAKTTSGRKVELSSSGHTVTFPGFLRAYVEGSDDPGAELESKERPLPRLEEGKSMRAQSVEAKGHETLPPSRFTEASLVQKLEELGVGRPSTYASILSTIVDRGYVWKKGSALVPTFTAFSVVALLEKHFGSLVDYAFTAKMEDDLDAIAGGEQKSLPYLQRFYFGNEREQGAGTNGKKLEPGLRAQVADHLDEIDARAINSLPLGSDDQGREIIVRVGKYGPYLQRGEDTASIPDAMPPDELTIARASALLEAPSGDRLLGKDPASSKPVYVRAGRFGAYIQLGDLPPPMPKDASKAAKKAAEKAAEADKPKRASLLKTQTPTTVTLDDALQLLSLPRTVGVDPTDKEAVTAQLGRYGPYVSKGKESRSLAAEGDVFTVTLAEALVVLAQPKVRQQKTVREPLKTFGDDPVSKQLIKAFTGKFGTYVTDGTTNATLRNEDKLEHMTPERAQELLQLRREKEAAGGGPPPRGAKGRGKPGKPAPKAAAAKAAPSDDESDASDEKAPAAKKAVAKKPAAKKAAAKKPAAKKPAARKAATKPTK